MQIVPPNRVTRTYTQHLCAPPATVFPLLCPVRETEWAGDWKPLTVFSESGVAEEDCVFVTAGHHGDEIWTVNRHDPDNWRVEMVMLAPDVVAMHLVIVLRPEADGCAADVRYVKTSLGRLGDAEIDQFTEAAWQRSMMKWEREMNEHLRSLSPSSR